jgi:hypothetical protein
VEIKARLDLSCENLRAQKYTPSGNKENMNKQTQNKHGFVL